MNSNEISNSIFNQKKKNILIVVDTNNAQVDGIYLDVFKISNWFKFDESFIEIYISLKILLRALLEALLESSPSLCDSHHRKVWFIRIGEEQKLKKNWKLKKIFERQFKVFFDV